MKSDQYEAGLNLFNQLHGGHAGEELVKFFGEICPKMANLTIETVMGDVMLNKILDLKTRQLCNIAAITTLGHALPQLKAHIQAALVVGTTREEIIELLYQIAFYAGFPAAVNALLVARDVFNSIDNLHI